jgi:hypothetical protein
MAFIDYGAIAFKNGKLMTKEFFGDMKEMVGWEDTEKDVYESRSHTFGEPESNYMKPINLKDECFAYVGDSDCTLAFYKEQIVIVSRYDDGTFRYDHEYLNCTNYTWSKWECYAGKGFAKVNVTKRNGYLVCKWKYKGDKYKVYFGYGVDIDYYLKWHIVNYYRSPEYRFRNMIRWFKKKI